MSKLTILANIVAKADKVDLVKTELLKLIDLTRVEEGCLEYNLHQDNENPAHFMFFENWQSRELTNPLIILSGNNNIDTHDAI